MPLSHIFLNLRNRQSVIRAVPQLPREEVHSERRGLSSGYRSLNGGSADSHTRSTKIPLPIVRHVALLERSKILCPGVEEAGPVCQNAADSSDLVLRAVSDRDDDVGGGSRGRGPVAGELARALVDESGHQVASSGEGDGEVCYGAGGGGRSYVLAEVGGFPSYGVVANGDLASAAKSAAIGGADRGDGVPVEDVGRAQVGWSTAGFVVDECRRRLRGGGWICCAVREAVRLALGRFEDNVGDDGIAEFASRAVEIGGAIIPPERGHAILLGRSDEEVGVPPSRGCLCRGARRGPLTDDKWNITEVAAHRCDIILKSLFVSIGAPDGFAPG